MNWFRLVGASAVVLVWLAAGVGCADAGDNDAKLGKAEIAVSEITVRSEEYLQGIKHAEFCLGATDRIFLIEDQWEYDRSARLIPNLPSIDLKAESLLVVTSWDTRPRFLHYVRSAGKTLIVGIAERSAPRGTCQHIPPQFLVARLPLWSGEVRFEINGQYQFTIWRGMELEKHTDRVWKEFFHLYSGNSPSTEQKVRHYSQLWPQASRDEVRAILDAGEKKYDIGGYALFPILLNDLADMRARPAVPRLFDLIESMERHDKAFTPAWKALVGIGGPEVVEHCIEALKSSNTQNQLAALLVLRDFAHPDTRAIAYKYLGDPKVRVRRGALNILYRLGLGKEDVPAMIAAIEQIESTFIETEIRGNMFPDLGDIIHAIGSLGVVAKDALPTLERLASSNHPSGIRKKAREALERIRIDPS